MVQSPMPLVVLSALDLDRQYVAALLNNEIKLDSRTSILAVEESISCVEDFQEDIQKYRNVTEEQILRIFHQTVNPQCDNTYFYLCK